MGGVVFPLYLQQDKMGCGPTCLRMIAKYHYDRDYRHEFMRDIAENGMDGSTMLALSQAAEKIGFRTMGVKITIDKLVADAPLPCILHWDSHHYVVLYDIQVTDRAKKYFIADPALGFYTLSETNFALHWLEQAPPITDGLTTIGGPALSLSGIALLLEKASDFKLSFFNLRFQPVLSPHHS